MSQSRETSPDLSQEQQDCVVIADNQNHQEEIMDDTMNTQAVLQIDLEPPKKKGKGIGKKSGKMTKVKTIAMHPFTVWLESLWQTETTLRVMKPWLQSIQKYAMTNKNVKLYKFGSAVQKIMKEFILWLKEGKKDLMNCSFVHFEDWYSNDGLSTIYGRFQVMDWESDFEETLFNLYSACVMELEARQKENETSDEELPISSSLRNTKNTSMSSTIAHTRDQRVDASTSKDFETSPQKVTTKKNQKDGKALKRVQFQKEKCVSKKQKISNEESDDEYRPGTLFQESQLSVEDESETEIDIQVKPTMKPIKRKLRTPSVESQEDEDSDAGTNDEDFASMVGNLAQAHCLVSNTGKISQSILIKDTDQYISMSTPGESGQMLMKLELYPFKDCSKLSKTEYWRKRTFSSLVVLSSKGCPVYNLAMKLRKEITKQVMKTKKVKVEKRPVTGWKSG